MAHNSQFLSLEPELRNILKTKNPSGADHTATNQIVDTPGQSRSQYTVKTPSLSHDIDKNATGNHNLEISRSVYHIYDNDKDYNGSDNNNNNSNSINLKDHHFPSGQNSNSNSGQKRSNKNKNEKEMYQQNYNDLYDSFSNITNHDNEKTSNNYNTDNNNFLNKYENSKNNYARNNEATKVALSKIRNPHSPNNQSTAPSFRSVLASNGQMVAGSR